MTTNLGGRGPKALGDLLGNLFAERGYGRLQAVGELEAAWVLAVGELGAEQTQVGVVRRGILNVTVAHPALLEELSSFQKPQILAILRREVSGTPILDIRFRVGPIGPTRPPTTTRSRRRPNDPAADSLIDSSTD